MPTTPYTDLAGAQEYFDERLDSEAWDDSTDENKLKALQTATRLINNLRFIGQRATSLQPNEFPRLGQLDVPSAIKEATCELALQLLDNVDPEKEIRRLAITSESYSTPKTSYNRDFVLAHIRNGIPSSEAWSKLVPYLADPLSVRLVRQ